MPFALPAPTTNVVPWAPIWANFVGIQTAIISDEAAIAVLQAQVATAPQALFDHFADVTTGGIIVTTLYSDTIAAGQLANNGDSIEGWYQGTTAALNTGNREWVLSFAGTTILDTSSLSATNGMAWKIRFEIIRDSSTSVRCTVDIIISKNDHTGTAVLFVSTQSTKIPGLTLSGTNVLLLTGQASVLNNNITASSGKVRYFPA